MEESNLLDEQLAVDVARRRLMIEHRNAKLLEEGWEYEDDRVDFVVRDGDVIHFVMIAGAPAASGDFPPVRPGKTRRDFERIMCAWVLEHPDIREVSMTLDLMSVLIYDPDMPVRAIVRTHRNAQNDLDA